MKQTWRSVRVGRKEIRRLDRFECYRSHVIGARLLHTARVYFVRQQCTSHPPTKRVNISLRTLATLRCKSREKLCRLVWLFVSVSKGDPEKAFVFSPRNSNIQSNVSPPSLKRARTDFIGTRDEPCGDGTDFWRSRVEARFKISRIRVFCARSVCSRGQTNADQIRYYL